MSFQRTHEAFCTIDAQGGRINTAGEKKIISPKHRATAIQLSIPPLSDKARPAIRLPHGTVRAEYRDPLGISSYPDLS